MISEDFYWEGGSLKVVFPCFQPSYDRKKFSVIDVIVSFDRGEGL